MPKRKALDQPSNAVSKVQLTLDFGQKNFGALLCKECFMVYTVGDSSDMKTHAKYHSKYLNQVIKVSRWQNQKVLEEYFDGSRVIEILPTDRVGMALYERLAVLMNRDLGYDQPTEIRFKSFDTTLHTPPLPQNSRVFIFVEGQKKTAVGCCIAEELTAETVEQRQYTVQRLLGGRRSLLSWRVNSEDGKQAKDAVDPTSSFTISPDQQPSWRDDSLPMSPIPTFPLCGVRRLWVASRHRRQKVASTLLDCVLKNLLYLTLLTRKQIAFCEPTANGADFATGYTGEENFIIY